MPHVGPLITAEQLVNEVRARLEVNGFASSQVQSLGILDMSIVDLFTIRIVHVGSCTSLLDIGYIGT